MALEEHFLPIRICGAWVSLRTLNLYEPNDLRVVRLCAVGGLCLLYTSDAADE